MSAFRQLPMIPIRDFVLFADSEAPLYVGRETSLLAIKLAKSRYDGAIAVFAQLRGEDNGPTVPDAIYHVGTLANVVASIEMTDKTIKGMLEGVERIRFKGATIVDGVTLVTVAPEPEATDDSPIEAAEHAEILGLLATWGIDRIRDSEDTVKQALERANKVVDLVRTLQPVISNPRIDNPGGERGWESLKDQPTTRYRDLKNQAVALRQMVLEEISPRKKLDLLVAAIKFDIACRTET